MSKDQNPSDKACDAYFDNPYAATSGSYYSDRVTFYAGFAAGAASRDAEVAELVAALLQVRKAICGDIHNRDNLLDLIASRDAEITDLKACAAHEADCAEAYKEDADILRVKLVKAQELVEHRQSELVSVIRENDNKFNTIQRMKVELAAARAEIERLSKSCLYEAQQWAKWSTEKNLQLAAEQAKNVGLRVVASDLLEFAINSTCGNKHAVDQATEALSAPSDTSALETVIKKADELVRERIASGFSQPHEEYFGDTIQLTIRALPAVTLEDLK